MSCPGYCSSLPSRRSNRVKASAVAPAKPPITAPLASRRTFLALPLTMVWPRLTWPSPPITTRPPRRTIRIVVACMRGEVSSAMREGLREDALLKHPPPEIQRSGVILRPRPQDLGTEWRALARDGRGKPDHDGSGLRVARRPGPC